jgi:hypothetical protein
LLVQTQAYLVVCQTILFSQDMTSEDERERKFSKEKISFSQLVGGHGGKQAFEETKRVANIELEEEDTEKDRNFTPKIFGKLSVEERKILALASGEVQ